MNLRKVVPVLLFLAQVAGGNGGNYFVLSNGNSGRERENLPSMMNFHLCSLNKDCTDVAENKVTGKLKQITTSEERQKAVEADNLMWTKVVLPPKGKPKKDLDRF